MCLGISGVWTHLGKGNQADMREKDAGRTFCTACNKDPLLIYGLPGSLVFFWAKNRQKVTPKKGPATGLLKKWAPNS